MYTLTVTKWEPLTEEEKQERDRYRGFNGGIDRLSPEMPYNMREVRVLTVQLTPEEWVAVKKGAIDAIK